MASFDYDVAIIGSGFGGSVAALRAAEKGYRVGVMESGRRWKDEDIPKTQWNLPDFLWFPAAEMYGIQRIEYLDDVLVLSGAGVGGGSHVYANTLYVPPKQFFDAPEWAGITDWADELAPCIDQATRMLGVVRYPYMPTDVDRYMQQVAIEMGRGETFNKAPVGVYFGSPGVEADDPYFGGVGPRRTGCISCGNCNIGCGHNAKNKLTTNYLYLAEKLGVEIHELHEVYDLVPLEGGGFEVHARHPGWAQRAAHLHRHTYTAEQVIVAAHAYGSSKLLLHMQHKGRLRACRASSGNERARTPNSFSRSPGPTDSGSAIRRRSTSRRGRSRSPPASGRIAVTSIEPTIWGVGSNVFALLITYHQHGEQKHPTSSWLKQLVEHPTQVLSISDPRHWSERTVIMLCMQTTDTSIELYWHDGLLRSRHGSGTPPPVHIPIVEDFVDRVAKKMDSGEGALLIRGHQPQRVGPLHRWDPDRRQQRQRRRRSLPARVRSAGPSRHGRERDAGQPGSEPVTHDHRPGRARHVTLAEQGRRGYQAALGLRLRARRPGHAAPSNRARRRSRRAATRREEVRHHPRLPLLNRARRKGEAND